jgi:outer membrane receptor protein involved in Fe transport
MVYWRGCRTTPLTAAILATLYPSLSPAQQESGKLETIIVTATRRELNLQEVPQSIAAFSTDDIERQALQDVEDVIRALPSVNLVNSQPGRNSIIMRGISTGSAEYYVDSQVSVYLDDQPLTSISQQVDIQPIDIERIEQLPGPQGTLFGSSSQSGTIRYITNKPDPAGFSAQLDLEIGTIKDGEESYWTSGHLNIPLGDKLAVRVVGFYSDEGGYVDNVLGTTFMGDRDNADLVEDDFNDFETYGGRIAARWLISPQWEATLGFIAQSSKADGSWETDPFLGDYKITRFFKEWRDDEWYQSSLNVKGDLGFAELSATASYFDRDMDYEWDDMVYDQWRTEYWPVFSNGVEYYALYDTDYLIGTTYNWQEQHRYTYEVRLTSQGESRFQWMAGAFYEDVYDWWNYGKDLPGLTTSTAWGAAQEYACAAYDAGYDVACPLPDTDIYYENIFDKEIKQTAVFGEVSYELTDQWAVTGGARWFEYDRREFDISHVPQGLPGFGGNAAGGRIDSAGKESDTVFKFSTQYKFDDDRMLYFLYSEGFRLGGNNSARAAETGAVPATYEPDKLENYELGLKSTWLDDSVQLNVSAFLMKWNDFQLNVDGPEGSPFWVRGIINGGNAEQKGVEISGVVNLTPQLVLEASAFLANPEFTEDTTIRDDSDPEDWTVVTEGTSMPVSPEEKYFVSAEYTIPNFMAWDGDLRTSLSYSYQSETWKDLDAAIERDVDQLIPSSSNTTLQLGFNHNSGWDATLIVRNLFDEKGINYLNPNNYGELFGDPRFRYIRTLQQPRTISLSFSKKW